MTTITDWRAACETVAEAVLAQAGIASPPVDALLIAHRLHVEVVWDSQQNGRARLQRLSGQTAIFLRPDARPERLQWAAAHELGEQFAVQVLAELGLAASDLLPRQREQMANQLANRILLPCSWFDAACCDAEGDLHRLKAVFTTASHELLAWRMLDRPGERVVTVWDHGQITRRRCNFAVCAPTPHEIEIAAWRQAHATGRPAMSLFEAGEVRVWPVHEPGWKREIAIATIDADRQ